MQFKIKVENEIKKAYDELADISYKNLEKGKLIAVEGFLTTEGEVEIKDIYICPEQ